MVDRSRQALPPDATANGTRAAPRTRILIADDHAVVRDGLVTIVNQEPDMQVVADVGDGREAVEQWRRHRPDVTLMDIRMPVLDGVAAIAEIRALDPDAKIVILTTFDADEDIYRGIRAGATSYLLKDIRREDLFDCIRHVHAGKTYFPPAVAARLIRLTDRSRRDALTTRETEVLRLLAEGLSNKGIANQLSITEVTVKSHVQAILRKLGALSRTEAIAIAHRTGLLRE